MQPSHDEEVPCTMHHSIHDFDKFVSKFVVVVEKITSTGFCFVWWGVLIDWTFGPSVFYPSTVFLPLFLNTPPRGFSFCRGCNHKKSTREHNK
jgi:hypothetical protein